MSRSGARRFARGGLANLVIAVLLVACSTGATPQPSVGGSTGGPGASGGSGGATGGSPCPTAAPAKAAAGSTATATIATPKGTIVIKLEADLGPLAVANFIALARCGYFDSVVFHRLVPGFVIQGGDGQYGRQATLDKDKVGAGGPGYEFKDDPVKAPYMRGTVAMANSGPDTNGSQFFIVLTDDNGLDPLYSMLGHVTSGMDVVDAIAAMPNSGGQDNAAVDPVPMTHVTITTP